MQTITVDVRVVAATNQDLRQAVATKAFREDLFFRLSVFPVEIPPLRRRRSDILALAEAFLARYGREMGRKGLKLSEASRRALLDHSWPGNIRELQNCLERGAILCSGTQIEPEHLLLSAGPSGGPSLGDVLDLSGGPAAWPRTRRSPSPCARRPAIARRLRPAWASASRP